MKYRVFIEFFFSFFFYIKTSLNDKSSEEFATLFVTLVISVQFWNPIVDFIGTSICSYFDENHRRIVVLLSTNFRRHVNDILFRGRARVREIEIVKEERVWKRRGISWKDFHRVVFSTKRSFSECIIDLMQRSAFRSRIWNIYDEIIRGQDGLALAR